MKKSTLISVLITFIIVVIAVVYVLNRTPTPETTNDTTTQQESTPEEPSPAQPTDEEQTTAGVYTDYSDDALANASGDTLLFFHASWCPQCQEIDADITANGVPQDVTVLKVDYDNRQDLRQKYGVTLQTTFVSVDSNGEKIDSYVAYEEPTFASVLRELVE